MPRYWRPSPRRAATPIASPGGLRDDGRDAALYLREMGERHHLVNTKLTPLVYQKSVGLLANLRSLISRIATIARNGLRLFILNVAKRSEAAA